MKLTEKEIEMFEFLTVLKESKVTNMFGASHYLVKEFHIDKYDARKALKKWMENYPIPVQKKPNTIK